MGWVALVMVMVVGEVAVVVGGWRVWVVGGWWCYGVVVCGMFGGWMV